MQIRLYKTADNPKKLSKSYTPDQTIARTFENVVTATFENGSEYNISALKLDFEAKQSGEGDPSPDNVRPITGHTQATVNLRSGNEFRAVFKSFGGTYYGGTYDAVTGDLTITDYYIKPASMTMGQYNQRTHGGDKLITLPYNAMAVDNSARTIPSINSLGFIQRGYYYYNSNRMDNIPTPTNGFSISSSRSSVRIYAVSVTSEAEYNDAIADLEIVYRLQTPLIVSVGPLTGLNLFPGQNRLFATNMTINQLAMSVKSGSALITTDNGTEFSQVQFITENDRKNPVLRVKTDIDLTAYNYAYISYYDRFYFVKVRNIAHDLYTLECSVDLLMTCKSDLLNLNCTIKRNAVAGSPYLYDELYHTQVYKLWSAKEFPQGLENESFVLMTVGTNITP